MLCHKEQPEKLKTSLQKNYDFMQKKLAELSDKDVPVKKDRVSYVAALCLLALNLTESSYGPLVQNPCSMNIPEH